jgi:hypothetical protein
MNNIALDVSEWDRFNQNMLELAQETMPKETKKFMRREGGRLATVTRKLARSTVHKKTGNYFKSIRSSKAWENKRGGYGVYAYSSRKDNRGNHAHLLEYGHRVVIRRTNTGKRAKDYRIFEKAGKSFEGKFVNDATEYIDKLLESNFTSGR